MDGFNVYEYVHNEPSDGLDPHGMGAVRVFFHPENVAEMGWTKRFTFRGPPGGYPAYAKHQLTVNCWNTVTIGLSPYSGCSCDIECVIDADFQIDIWYVYAIRRFRYRDVPYEEHPAKTIEGLFGHEQRHVKNWREFLLGLEQETRPSSHVHPLPMDGCAGGAHALQEELQRKIDAFEKDEADHKHIPPANGVHYPPLKGAGTMPSPDIG